MDRLNTNPEFARWSPSARRTACARRVCAVLCAVAVVGDAGAAKRSKKQQEIDAQREEMRQQAEQRQKDPSVQLAPSILSSKVTFNPIPTGPVLPPWEAARRQNGSNAPLPGFTVSVPDPFEPSLPTNLAARVAGTTPAAASEPARRPAVAAPAASSPAVAGGSDALLRHASFLLGAELFNSALDLFRKFEDDKNSEHLARIPAMCSDAVKAFEVCRASHPGDARLGKYVDQCHGLTRYARQSELMASGQASP